MSVQNIFNYFSFVKKIKLFPTKGKSLKALSFEITLYNSPLPVRS